MKPTEEEFTFVMERVQYGYESHHHWEMYFRDHQCAGDNCTVCQEMKLLGDADFHASQKRRYEIEVRVLTWVKDNCLN